MKKSQLLWKLFISTFYLSAFTFGGGYVIVSLMKKTFVDEYHWIDEDEMLDFVAIAQSAPGPIAVNGAIVVGYKLAGLMGIVVGVVATVLPPLIIVSIITVFYNIFKENFIVSLMLEGMQAGVGAIIACVVYEMISGIFKQKDYFSVVIMFVAFIAIECFDISVMTIIVVCIIVGLLQTLFLKRGEQL